jgi:hypothetical protein
MTGKVDIQGTGTTPTITLYGDTGLIAAGVKGASAGFLLYDGNGTGIGPAMQMNAENRIFLIHSDPNPSGLRPVISMNGKTGMAGIGGNGQDGHLGIFPAGLQGSHPHDDITKATIHLDGKNGDIILQNADCAEDFEITDTGQTGPGTVMVIAEDGALRCSENAYDKRVAGVVSGAKDLRPGIVLGRQPAAGTRHPIALVGQVYCKADAEYAPIDVGDLLTTSPTAGHAMRAIDPLKAFGAVIGKALSCLNSGQGLIRILVALQ